MIYKSLLFLVLFLFFVRIASIGQRSGMIKYLNQGESRSSWKSLGLIYGKEESLKFVAGLDLSEPIEFPDLAFPDEEFLPLDSSGIYINDLNFDGNYDLIYQGMSSYTQQAIKIYFNRNEFYDLQEIITGYVLSVDIDTVSKKIYFLVHNPPCHDCLSYGVCCSLSFLC